MASVTFPANLGGSGQTISDDADPNTGLANGGHRLRFVPALQGSVDMAQYVYQYAAKIDNAAEDAQRAENARAYVEAYAGALKSNIETYYDKLATLKLDFGRGKYFADDGDLTETTSPADLLTVTRATPKWVEGPDGKLREVLPNVIARQWRNGVPQGTLLEKSSTNLLLWSEDFTNAVWTKTGINITSSEPFEGVSDSLLAQALVEDTSSGEHRIQQTTEVLAGEVYTISAYVDINKCDKNPYLRFAGVATGTVRLDIATSTLAGDGGEIEHIHGSIYRFSLTATAESDGTLFARWGIYDGGTSYQGDGQSTIYMGIPQLEKGYTSSSYIPTTDAPVTRAADNVSRVLGDEFNPREGTFFFRFVPTAEPSQNFAGYATNSTNTSNRSFQVNGSRGTGKIMASARAGSTPFASAEAEFVVGTEYKAAVTISPLQPAASINGVVNTGVGDNTGLTTDMLLRAMTGGFAADGVLFLGATYIPRALTETELQELTS